MQITKIFLIWVMTLNVLFNMPTAFASNNALTNTFVSELYHYSINYPADWKVADHGDGVVVFAGPADNSANLVTVNIQTIYTKQGGGKYKSVKDLMDDFFSQVPMHTQKAKFLERKQLSLLEPGGTNLSAEETTLTFNENRQAFKQWQIMTMNKNGILFQALAYRAPIKYFDANRPLVASMVASWVIH